jgi:hypothetical protein
MTESALAILYETTHDTPDGIPWPPIGGDFYWCAVKHGHDRTVWRRVALQAFQSIGDDPAAEKAIKEGRVTRGTLELFQRAAERLRRNGYR